MTDHGLPEILSFLRINDILDFTGKHQLLIIVMQAMIAACWCLGRWIKADYRLRELRLAAEYGYEIVENKRKFFKSTASADPLVRPEAAQQQPARSSKPLANKELATRRPQYLPRGDKIASEGKVPARSEDGWASPRPSNALSLSRVLKAVGNSVVRKPSLPDDLQ